MSEEVDAWGDRNNWMEDVKRRSQMLDYSLLFALFANDAIIALVSGLFNLTLRS